MKRFFLVSLLLTLFMAAYACIDEPIDRYYIYYLPEQSTSWSERRDQALAAEWSRLLGTDITPDDVSYIPDDRDLIKKDSYSKIARICSDGRHPEELAYLYLISEITKESRFSYNDWDYPSKEEIASHEKNLADIRDRVKRYRGSRLAPQYRLQEMRMSFALKDWDDCRRIWEAAPKDDSIFTEMMRNLYAGALYRTGHSDEAFAIYSEMGDNESASWCAARTGSVDGIRLFYDRDVNSKVLPFLIRQFCNNTQETLDVLSDNPEGLEWLKGIGAREINRQDADRFVALAEEAAANPKVTDKALWLGAAALVRYYYGDTKEAARLLARAKTAPASEQSRTANDYIAIFVDLANAPDSRVSDMAAEDVAWLLDHRDMPHSRRMLHRLVNVDLDKHLSSPGDVLPLLAATAADQICYPDRKTGERYSDDYSSEYFSMLNTLPIETVLEWKRANDSGNLGKWTKVMKAVDTDPGYLSDIIGTRLMRQGRWAEARPYLAATPLSILSKQNISPFATTRDFRKLPWMTSRERVKEWTPVKVSRNAKLEYCDYVQNLERNQRTREDAMKLAAAYFNASPEGKCWWLTDYSWSCEPDSLAAADRDLAADARALLKKAYKLPGKVLPAQIKFAQVYTDKDPLTEYDYSLSKSVYLKNGDTYRDMTELSGMLSNTSRNNWPAEIRRCDIFRQFLRQK